MKRILLFSIFLLALPLTANAENFPAGFASPPHVIPNQLIAGQPARIYSTIYNQSNNDLIGKLQFYYNNQLLDEIPATLPAQSTERYWFDTTITTGTQQFSEMLIDVKKTELGKIPEPVTLATSSMSVTVSSISSTSTIQTTTTSSSSTSNLITISSPTSSLSTSSPDTASSSSSTLSNFLNSPLTQTATEKTKNIVQTITSPLVNLLNEKQHSLEQEIKNATTSEPIPVLNQAADALEKKTTFLKIPRDKLPTFTNLYIWLIIAAKYILNTWWVMLLIFLALLRTMWKLWRRIQREEEE